MVTTYTQGSRQMKKLLLAAAFASAQLLAASAAEAVTFNFTSSFSPGQNDNDGLSFSGTTANVPQFDLNNVGNFKFVDNFLKIESTDTRDPTSSGNQTSDNFSLSFNFTSPSIENPSVDGTGTEKVFGYVLFGIWDVVTGVSGSVHFDPKSVTFDNGAILKIALSDAFFQNNDNPNQTLYVDATFTLEKGALIATPLPAALPLFAAGLGGMGMLSWRRKRKLATLAAA
jgi:hypothetical protein